MKTRQKKTVTSLIILLITGLILHSTSSACTIVSAIARNGHVWTANNEDGPFGVGNFINVFPKTGKTKYGYYTFSYLSPRYGEGGAMQGGMNEAGLTFDFNALSYIEGFDPAKKQSFPGGDNAILPHLLANMSSTKEVIDFFEKYWFQNGFRSAQMHVSDSKGNFAIISASGIQQAAKGQPLVSTNFDICGKEDGSACWRFPIASSIVSNHGINLSTMMKVCRETTQKNGATMYSNVQNLTTGDVWFFSKHDPGNIVKTNIRELLAKGQRSYSFSDLNAIKSESSKEWIEPTSVRLTNEQLKAYEGSYKNPAIGQILVNKTEQGIQISFSDGMTLPLIPQSKNVFYLPKERISIAFDIDDKNNRKTMKMHENGSWSFTAWEDENGR